MNIICEYEQQLTPREIHIIFIIIIDCRLCVSILDCIKNALLLLSENVNVLRQLRCILINENKIGATDMFHLS
jgi:hypothetical protein